MISVTILTKNSEATLSATLAALQPFAEVLILDNGSTDTTKEIALSYPNVRWMEEPFQGFGILHNLAAKRAKYDWILSIDSDEVVSSELLKEILSLQLDPQCVYALDRRNYFGGKWIKTCSGWHPDFVVRLFHRGATQFTDAAVHEKVIADHLKVVRLKGGLLHTPYRSIDAFLEKMQLYSSLFAEQNEGKRSSLGKALFRGAAAFVKNYFFKRGFLGGAEGLIISLYNAQTTYYKYLKLADRYKSLHIQTPAQESKQPNREG